ncbi:MAG: sulfite exporter TauE/SafE family protein [Cyclobacteriaceae bacterium]|nr:MAG: sulfite exporter TauE/SafE family protein [Cyclobacteriaceae bacterium]
MSWYEYPIIIAVGFAAAFLNTVGGGGSLFSVPILTFIGLPITTANATSRVAILFQNIFAVGGFKSKGIELPWPYSLYLGIASLGVVCSALFLPQNSRPCFSENICSRNGALCCSDYLRSV